MITRFECLNCHHVFTADDKLEASCPHCGSDNVRPKGRNLTRPLLLLVAFIGSFCVGFWGIKTIRSTDNPTPPVDEETVNLFEEDVVNDPINPSDIGNEEASTITNEQKKIEEASKTILVPQPVTLFFTTPKADAVGNYSFVAKTEHLPTDVRVRAFMLTSVGGSNVIVTSANGKFSSVPASAEKGEYDLKAELTNGQIVTRDRIGGFDKVEIQNKRMTAEELTTLLNAQDKDLNRGKNPKVIHKPAYVINNSTDANDKQLTMIDDIMSRLHYGSWKSVKVTSVDYDAQGRVCKFAIDIAQ